MIKPVAKKIVTLSALSALGWAWFSHVQSLPGSDERTVADKPTETTPLQTDTRGPGGVSTAQIPPDPTTQDGRSDQHESPLATARALIESGHVDDAIREFERVLAGNPSDTTALMELAMAHILDRKNPAAARPLLERIIQVDPTHHAALRELEVIYEELNMMDDGREFIRLKAEQNPASKQLRLTYGKLISGTDPAQALQWLQTAADDPDVREEALDAIAAAAIAAGKKNIAKEALIKSLKISEDRLKMSRENHEQGLDYLEDRIAGTKKQLQDLTDQF